MPACVMLLHLKIKSVNASESFVGENIFVGILKGYLILQFPVHPSGSSSFIPII